ncbi:MAG TPA: nucleotidyltransferase domain-containing protein [Nitrososphaeria archaeon]|nr:nucleotidyltransferase domain-containing protein [Nitrososphaeria archaeon]
MRKRSLNSARVRFLNIDYDWIINYLKNYAKDALRKGAKLIILYGSLARGDYTATSDADILIISDKFKDIRIIDRMLDFLDPSSPIDIEPRVLTTEEFKTLIKKRDRFASEVLRDGIVLIGDMKLYREFKSLAKESERN